MHALIQSLLIWYFSILEQFGLWGVVILMAMESSIFPVPSELVIPPAAYTESHLHGQPVMLTMMVILAGTFGSLLGASITYWVARWLGYPFMLKFGKYVGITPEKMKKAELWVDNFGAGGIFIARLIPVVRHVIGIPAGVVKMRFSTFCFMTVLGSALWCTALTIFGLLTAEHMEAIITEQNFDSPEYQAAINSLTISVIILACVIVILYYIGIILHKRLLKKEAQKGTVDDEK